VLERANDGLLLDPKWRNPGATPYDILGVEVGATPEDIRLAYRRLANLCHPDHFSKTPHLRKQAEFVTKRINKAYMALGQRPDSRFRANDRSRWLRTDRSGRQSQLHAPAHFALLDPTRKAGDTGIVIMAVVVGAMASILVACVIVLGID
jgi:hypothetical protein